MKGNNEETAIRRFLIMGCCSLLLHMVIAAMIILHGISVEKPAKAYSVEVKYLQTKTEQTEEAEPVAVVPKRPELEETRKVPEKPAVVDLTQITAPVSLETVILLEEALEKMDVLVDVDIVETSIPLAENAIITQDGGLGSGADAEAGGGNSLLAAGTERGWGGDAIGVGWGGGSGSPGSGGGTGGGHGSGTGNSRGRAGDEETGVYSAGMPGITPPVYDRTPQPNYPEASRRRREEGELLLKVEVLANGRVGRLDMVKSSGFALLDEAALRTVRNWRFKAALKGREAVICWVNIPISFRLNN